MTVYEFKIRSLKDKIIETVPEVKKEKKEKKEVKKNK